MIINCLGVKKNIYGCKIVDIEIMFEKITSRWKLSALAVDPETNNPEINSIAWKKNEY